MATAIEFDHVSKQYRLGLVSTGTLSHDLKRWWTTSVLHKEDPYLKIGEVNDRSTKGDSEYVWALRDIDFKVEEGDVVGIIGKNGAGKSTLLKLLSKVTAPTVGTIRARGRIASLLEVGTGFHQEMTGRENIYLNGAILGMTKQEINRKLDEIIDFSGCERYIDTPVKRYSSGMTVRLGFAVAAFLDPEILVVDEVLAVGDAEFQKKAISKMKDVSTGEGRTVLFVSHNMGSIRKLCKKGVLLENGCVKYIGNVESTIQLYLQQNLYQEGTLLNSTKVCTSFLSFNEITINGKNTNTIDYDGKVKDLEFIIKGKSEKKDKVAFELYFCDNQGTLLASYTPYYDSGVYYNIEVGDFTIEVQVSLPLKIASGTYLIYWSLSHPKVELLSESKEPIKLNVSNMSFNDGTEFNYRNGGFISL